MTAGLLERVARQANEEVDTRLAAARADASRCLEAGDAERSARRDSAIAARAAHLKSAHDAACAAATMRTAGTVLSARARFLDRVFGAAEALVSEPVSTAPGSVETLRDAARTLLVAALSYVDLADCRVRCRATAESTLRRVATDHGIPATRVTIDETVPFGAIVESADGRVWVDATISGLVRRRRADLSVLALAAFSEAP